MLLPPRTFNENLLYNTLIIRTENSTGTGFLYNLEIVGKGAVKLLFTNKHVIEGASSFFVKFHLSDDKGNPVSQYANIEVDFNSDDWIFHPDDIDLCCYPISKVINQYFSSTGKNLFYTDVDSSFIPSSDEWDEMSVGEQVYMIGYPRGISDEVNNLPLTRTGIFSTPPSRDYNGKKEFLVDMACFPGSSGSPIYYTRPPQYMDKATGDTILSPNRKHYFCGVLYGGPVIELGGEIVFDNNPKVITSGMINIGNCIKSSEILLMEEIVISKFSD